MGSWFGDLGLAYKYIVVFMGLLLLAIIAGAIKLFYDRRKLQEHIKKQELERAHHKEDTVELNVRERDEGDLFGVRAIEAGYFGGVHQSRPTSGVNTPRAGSPSASSNTLVAEQLSQRLKEIPSSASSVRSMAITDHQRSASREVESGNGRRKPPHLILQPSEAELSGRINHNGPVNMNLNVPPSPILQKQQQDANGQYLHPTSPNRGTFEHSGRPDGHDSPARSRHDAYSAQGSHSREGSNQTWDEHSSPAGSSRQSPESHDYPSYYTNANRSPPRDNSRSLTPTGQRGGDKQTSPPGYGSGPNGGVPAIREPSHIYSAGSEPSSRPYSAFHRSSSPIDPHGMPWSRQPQRDSNATSGHLEQPAAYDSMRSSFSFSDAEAEYALMHSRKTSNSATPRPYHTPASGSISSLHAPQIPLPEGLAEPLDLERPSAAYSQSRPGSSHSLQQQRFSRYFGTGPGSPQTDRFQRPSPLNVAQPQSAARGGTASGTISQHPGMAV